jgi:hypothetical protein
MKRQCVTANVEPSKNKDKQQKVRTGAAPFRQVSEIQPAVETIEEAKCVLEGRPGGGSKRKNEDNSGSEKSKKKKKQFDRSKHPQRHIALKVAYLGASYQGFQDQLGVEATIENKIFQALETTRLIEDRFSCSYSRCGRTDRGVSAMGQVISLFLRCKSAKGVGVIVPQSGAAEAGAAAKAKSTGDGVPVGEGGADRGVEGCGDKGEDDGDDGIRLFTTIPIPAGFVPAAPTDEVSFHSPTSHAQCVPSQCAFVLLYAD